ncbi:Serine/Threonine kinase (macronuclear) [Tetrahymena thermophila SB210]|uniref:Serine/Threonine kinase n=1 Tax=Tetrahymena thermophila (strain SB210) TaxID=312017 RepID=Q248G7_TETTS|nr:Serine/Threonine kinase [Tetrahymena thermophila SB210]EAS04078.4 Serine/Threonine kinase [Tetrahymena thermophila SB210]|eukprot:XP_001024323.4 Serine/Threonine kinase [Tetrahymena thermophila SB210]
MNKIDNQNIAEKIQLLEQRISKNGQATIQSSFKQNIESLQDQTTESFKGSANNGMTQQNSVENSQLEKNNQASSNKENVKEEEEIQSVLNKKGDYYEKQFYESSNLQIGQVMHKMDEVAEQLEQLEQDDEENQENKSNKNNQHQSNGQGLLNSDNIWDKQNSNQEGNYQNDTDEFYAPQEKLSDFSSMNILEAKDMQQQQLLKIPQPQIQQQNMLQVQQQLEQSDRHQQQQNAILQQGITTNQSTGGASSLGQKGTQNTNTPVMQNSREKYQKSTGKKRRTTQTTLAMNKLKKYDTTTPCPSIVQIQNTNQVSNRPRLNSESSNSNEAIQLNNVPPPGNSKITQFFKMKNTPTQNTTAISGQPLNNLNSQPQQQNQINNQAPQTPSQQNGQQVSQKENINIQVLPPQNLSNGQSLQTPSISQYNTPMATQNNSNYPNTNKKSVQNTSNGMMIDENKIQQNGALAHLQSPSQSVSSIANANSTNSNVQQNSTSSHHQHYNQLKLSSSNQMKIYDPKLENRYQDLQEEIKQKELELNEKNNIIKYLEQDKKEIDKLLQISEKTSQNYKAKAQKIIQQTLLEVEKLKREEMRQYIAKEKQRLGEYVQTRDCTKFDETWQEGTEFKKIKERLRVIEAEKEELEKKKKNVKGSRKSTNETDISQELDLAEQKQRINLQIQFLQKEEADLIEMYKNLDHEKFLFVQKLKRFQDEQNSRYGQEWPCLGERYQLLSLLGRGGFSEVYKAYDLHEFKEVACKIHQLNLNWSEPSKANYIKHAVRESKIHSELKHANIVQLYDTVEIDNNSFATILEYCEGPDLYFYLKKHKVLPEKEAKILIRQILCALRYMNSLKTRIIHYDLKPQNIIFHKGELKISDFGLSKIFDDGQTRMELTSQGVGTYWYLPPETFEFENSALISPKVDIWSVGVIFFEMVFGQRPFGNNKSQDQILKENIILKSTSVTFPSKPSVSNECKDFIRNCLTYDQNRRWDIQKAWDSPYMNSKTR